MVGGATGALVGGSSAALTGYGGGEFGERFQRGANIGLIAGAITGGINGASASMDGGRVVPNGLNRLYGATENYLIDQYDAMIEDPVKYFLLPDKEEGILSGIFGGGIASPTLGGSILYGYIIPGIVGNRR